MRSLLPKLLGGWLALTCAGAVVIYAWSAIDAMPLPAPDAQSWALRTLRAVEAGAEPDTVPKSAKRYRAAGPIFVTAWHQGRPVARYVRPRQLVEAVRGAAKALRRDARAGRIPGWQADDTSLELTVEVTRGWGPLVTGIPFVSNLGLVPLREGIMARVDGKRGFLTPQALRASGAYDAAVPTPIPDLSFGVDIEALARRVARRAGADVDALRERGTLTRFRADLLREQAPKERVSADRLKRAARRGARFLLRHQLTDGRYTYVYDAHRDRAAPAGYSLARHAGTTYFLAQAARLLEMPEARRGARRALQWLRRHHVRECGSPARSCVAHGRRATVGPTALALLAAAELLAGGEDAAARRLTQGFTTFLRSMQRPDGELMHEYDLEAQRRIDVQHLYYSGEAAFALLRAYRVLGERADLEAARRLMKHLTGAGWSFLGSRYYYGEEHWTCMAVEAADAHLPMDEGFEFCRRWARYNRRMQYGSRETPWRVRGAYGVGPVLVPRTTPAATRSEAFISVHAMARRRGEPARALRRQVERGLAFLLRHQWTPGPTHLMMRPTAASGGMPASPASLHARNDFVQHACSAMARWAAHLEASD